MIDDSYLDEPDWDEPVGSCIECGTNIYEDEIDDSGLCDQCLWRQKVAGE